MRHRDKNSVLEALQDWKALREKVLAEGGENYDQPVLVKFLDTGTFEVMDRDIVEDEFYVLRQHKILRELDAAGKDLEQAIGDARKESPRRGRGSGRGGGKGGSSGAKGSKSGNRRGGRRGRRRGRRTGKRGPGKGEQA